MGYFGEMSSSHRFVVMVLILYTISIIGGFCLRGVCSDIFQAWFKVSCFMSTSIDLGFFS